MVEASDSVRDLGVRAGPQLLPPACRPILKKGANGRPTRADDIHLITIPGAARGHSDTLTSDRRGTKKSRKTSQKTLDFP
jgi:hypothetical protein